MLFAALSERKCCASDPWPRAWPNPRREGGISEILCRWLSNQPPPPPSSSRGKLWGRVGRRQRLCKTNFALGEGGYVGRCGWGRSNSPLPPPVGGRGFLDPWVFQDSAGGWASQITPPPLPHSALGLLGRLIDPPVGISPFCFPSFPPTYMQSKSPEFDGELTPPPGMH